MKPEVTLVNPSTTYVTVVEPERISLLGLILRGVLERRLLKRPTRLRGDVLIEAAGMVITLRFVNGGVQIMSGHGDEPSIARVRGSLAALLDAALGRGRLRAWLSGRLAVAGQPLALWRLLGLLQAGGAA